MKTIKKAQSGYRSMGKSESKKALGVFGCKSPGDCPGGGRKASKWSKRDQREQETYSQMKDRERFGKGTAELPKLLIRKQVREDEGGRKTYDKQGTKTWKEDLGSETNVAKRGKKILPKLKVAKKGIKTLKKKK
jgi:hypothetical protein